MRAMRALTLRARVRIEPVKPLSFAVKVPMVAIVLFLFAVSGRSIAASMAVAKAGDDRTAPEWAGTHVEGGTEKLSCFARNGGDPGSPLDFVESGVVSARG